MEYIFVFIIFSYLKNISQLKFVKYSFNLITKSLLLHFFINIFSFLLKLYFGLFSQGIFIEVNIRNVIKLFKLVDSVLRKFQSNKTEKSFSQILHLQMCCCIQKFIYLLHTSFSVNFLH